MHVHDRVTPVARLDTVNVLEGHRGHWRAFPLLLTRRIVVQPREQFVHRYVLTPSYQQAIIDVGRFDISWRPIFFQVVRPGRCTVIELADQRRVTDVNLFVFFGLKFADFVQVFHLHRLLDLCHGPLENRLVLLTQGQEARIVIGQQNSGQSACVSSQIDTNVGFD